MITIPRKRRPVNSWLIAVPMAGVFEEYHGDNFEAAQASDSFATYFDSLVIRRRFTHEERRGEPVSLCLNHPKFGKPVDGGPRPCPCFSCGTNQSV